ncbi:MAG TPA: hypothetical protein V6D50_04105 [Chroococcales cyanobacterium]
MTSAKSDRSLGKTIETIHHDIKVIELIPEKSEGYAIHLTF